MKNQPINRPNLFSDLTPRQIKTILPIVLGDDSYTTQPNQQIGYLNFYPCSFTISERISNSIPLSDNERIFSTWLKLIINDLIDRYRVNKNINEIFTEVARYVFENIVFLLGQKYRGKLVADTTWNQEFTDIVAKTLQFTIGIDPLDSLDSHKIFNQLSIRFIPRAIDHLSLLNESAEMLLKFSIASGLSGLDLKGATAAASEYAQQGIKMSHLLSSRITEDQIVGYCNDLRRAASGPCPLFDYNTFNNEIRQSKKLIWFTDDVIESMFDLLFIQKILSSHPSLHVMIVPKNGFHANDFGWQHLEQVIGLPHYEELTNFITSGRLQWSCKGPRMSTVNLQKLSPEVVSLIHRSDVAVIKGCRMHEMLQGGLDIPSYTSYIVARNFSEIVSGFDATEAPLLFFRTNANEYSFYGFSARRRNPITMKNGRTVFPIISTTKDHFERKRLTNTKELTNELGKVIEHIDLLPSREQIAAIVEANYISLKLLDITRNTYNRMAVLYAATRGQEPSHFDKLMWTKLIDIMHCHVNSNLLKLDKEQARLLDVGAGHGRDLKYAQNELNLRAVGIENSTSFVEIIHKHEKEGVLAANSIIMADMCDLSKFENNSFEIVRHNATLHHLPFIASGYMADKAISECYRVMKPFGILFILVKEGNGIDIIDTEERLGERFYQFYSPDSLSILLQRNKFQILEISMVTEKRGNKVIPWIVALATKGEI